MLALLQHPGIFMFVGAALDTLPVWPLSMSMSSNLVLRCMSYLTALFSCIFDCVVLRCCASLCLYQQLGCFTWVVARL